MTPDMAKIFLLEARVLMMKKKKDFLLLGAKYSEALLKQRVFSKGINSNELSIGKYKDRKWATKRFNAGRQIAYVDLNFTGSLMDSIQSVVDEQDAVVHINDDKKYLIAKGQEELQGRKKGLRKMDIWNLTKKEEEAVQNYIEELIDEQIDRL